MHFNPLTEAGEKLKESQGVVAGIPPARVLFERNCHTSVPGVNYSNINRFGLKRERMISFYLNVFFDVKIGTCTFDSSWIWRCSREGLGSIYFKVIGRQNKVEIINIEIEVKTRRWFERKEEVR